MQHFKNQQGFTLVESLLALVIAAVMGVSLIVILRLGVDSFASIAARKDTLSEVRLAVSRMTRELILVEAADILEFSPNNIRFLDSGGIETEFRVEPSGALLRLFRGNNILAEDLNTFTLNYFDENDALLVNFDNPTEIRRIQISIEIENQDEGQGLGEDLGSLAVRGEVMPRALFYTNFQ